MLPSSASSRCCPLSPLQGWVTLQGFTFGRLPSLDAAGETMFHCMLSRNEAVTATFIMSFNAKNVEHENLTKLAIEHPTQCAVLALPLIPSVIAK